MIEKIIEAIKKGDVELVNSFENEFEKLDYNKNNKKIKDFILSIMSEFRKTDDIEMKKSLNSLLNWNVMFKFSSVLKEDFKTFILENLRHKNGNIRHQAVRMGGKYFGCLSFDKNDKEMNDFKIDFIKTLLSLVEEYSEKDKDKIDKSAPCVYKSLMLLLEDISFPDFGEELIKDDNLVMKIGEYIDQFYFIYYPDLLKYSNNDFGLSDADEAYYDAMDFLLAGDWKKAEIILDDAFLDHSDSIQIYVGLAAVYRYSDNFENWRLIIEMGYDELLKQFPKWPNEMSWGKITNRQYLRMIELKALLLYKQNKIEGAKKLYKLLIKLNPYDNQGIRYCLAGIYEGLSADDIEEMLGNEDGKIDPVKIKKIEELFEKQNKIHNFFNIEDEDDDYDDDISETDFTDENKAAFKWIIK